MHDSKIRTSNTAVNSLIPYTGREAFSRYVITTNAASIKVRSLTDVAPFAGGYNSTGLLVNGTPQGNGSQLGTQGSTLDTTYTLPGGSVTLQLIDGPASGQPSAPPVRYTPILYYWLPKGSSHSVTSPTAPSKRIVDLGDSIQNGAFVDAGPNQASAYQAIPVLIRANAAASGSGTFAGASVTSQSSGGRRLSDEAGSAGLRTASISRLTSELDGTVANLLIVTLGVNDYIGGTSAATTESDVGTWIDEIHTALPSLTIVLVSMLIRSNEGAANAGGSTPPQCRTALSNVSAARSSYCKYVDGLTLIPAVNATYFNADNLHLTTFGQSTYESNLRAALNALSLGY